MNDGQNKLNQTLLSHLIINSNNTFKLNFKHSWRNNTSQFAQDEMSIGTMLLTEMMIDTGTFEPVSQKPYPIAMKHYQWVKDEIEKLQTAKVV